MTGAQYAVAGELSDCEPVISGNRVYWYTWEDSVVRFYSIDLEQPEHAEVVERVSRHEFEPASEPDADGNAVDVCTKCGFTIPHDPQPTFLTGIRKLVPEGDRIHKQIINTDFEYLDAGHQFEIFVNNISLKTEIFPLEMVRGYDYLKRCEKVRRFQVKEFDEPAISFVLRIEPLFVASQDQTHRITARHSFEIQEIKEPNDTEDGSITLKCSGCGHVSTFAMNTLTGANGEAVTAVISDHPGQEPAVTVALTDPETGGPVIAEAGTDYSVAYVQDPEKDTSYAVIVAAKNSRKIKGSFVLPFTIPEMQEPAAGDADGDGQLTAQDAELLAEWLLSDPETVIPNPQAVDMNQDQKLNAVDLTLIKRILIGQTDL